MAPMTERFAFWWWLGFCWIAVVLGLIFGLNALPAVLHHGWIAFGAGSAVGAVAIGPFVYVTFRR